MENCITKLVEQKNKDLEKFFKSVKKTSKCWLWTGYMKNKYGGISYQGKQIGAHRCSWLLHRGEIPHKICVLHKCDNMKCVNPNHLFLGTHKDNSQDMLNKKRGKWHKGEDHKSHKLTNEIIKKIRTIYKPYSRQFGSRKLGRTYGISHTIVLSIIKKKKWKHIS